MAVPVAASMLGRAVIMKGARKKGASVFKNSFKSAAKMGIGKLAMKAMFGKNTPAKPAAPAQEEKNPTWGDHLKEMQDVFGGVSEKLKSFGTATVGAAADLESGKIGFDFAMSKLQPPKGGKGGKGKGRPASAADLQKKFDDYWKALRENAQTTAFSADKVMEGGMIAVKLTKGDTAKAMQLVKLAEDMAAFNPGKSVSEAMEAIEAAKDKDYKKLQEFGFEFKGGGWNKFLQDADKWFKGGGDKLNASANGMWEIMNEGMKMSLANAGVAALEQVKPIMQRLVKWLNNGGFKKLEDIAAKTVDVLVKSFLWLADVLGPVFGWLEKALDWVSANFETLRPILNGLVAAFAAFTVISTVASIISGIGVFIGLLANPIFWIVAAIGLLTAAWTGNWFGIQDKTKAAIAWIVAAYQGFVKSIKQFVEDTKQLFADLGAWIQYLWSAAVAGVEGFVNRLVTGTVQRWNQLVQTVTQLGREMKAWLLQTWSDIVSFTTDKLTRLWQAVSAAFQYVWGIVSGVMSRILNFYGLVWDGMVKIVTGAGSFIADTVRSAFGAASGIVTAAFDTIVGVGRAAMDMLRGILKGVWQGAAGDHIGAVRTIRDAVFGAFGKVGALLSGFAAKSIGYAKQFVTGYASGLLGFYQTVKDAVMPVWGVITSVWSAIADFVVSAAKAAWAGLQAAWSAISTYVVNAFNMAIAAIQRGWARAVSFVTTTAQAIKQWAISTANAVIAYAIQSFQSFIAFAKAVGPAIVAYLVQTFDAFVSGAIQAFHTVIAYIQTGAQLIWNVITSTMSAIGTFFVTAWNTISSVVVNAFRAMYAWAANTLIAIWGVIQPVFAAIGNFTTLMWGIIVGAFAWGVRIVYDVMNGLGQQAMSFGTQFMNGLIDGFTQMWGTLVQTVQEIWDSVKNIFGGTASVNMSVQPVHGSHRSGLNRVPFNGYIAQLHQGEMVLTSEQAGQYRSGQLTSEQRSSMLQPYSAAGGGTVNQSKSVEISNLIGEMHVHDEADENRFIDKLKRMLEEDLLTGGEGVYAG
ncbi:phage tail protein [Paenibacillus harenae]|uniref:phage tail protein n=1 Tax=Paenibacillus harenae TaxID=306543 RepID=UPI0027950BC9|nr:hypothetical protein [Paenibacillus harenae]MDQ0060123.1 phage-related protein [Paenibacillus harenae]